MRKILVLLGLAFALLVVSLDAQEIKIIQEPPGKSAGRVVRLRKLAVAHDDEGSFIFKRPRSIVSIDDGSFFVIDDGKVLRFSKEAKFQEVIVGKGEGPGEATYLYQLYRRGDDLIVNTGFMRKLMVFDLSGKLKTEHKETGKRIKIDRGLAISESNFNIMAHKKDNSLIVMTYPTSNTSIRKDDHTRKNQVFLLSARYEWLGQLFEIPVESFNIKLNWGRHLLPRLTVVYASAQQSFFFSNTERYEIKKYHIDANKIVAVWKREYRPVLVPDELQGKLPYGGTLAMGSRGGRDKIFKVPQPKHMIDIVQLFLVDSKLWVMTSTFDNEKGILFDVYNQEGEYVDNFYLSFPQGLYVYTLPSTEIHICKKNLLIREVDPDGNPTIVKYEILDT